MGASQVPIKVVVFLGMLASLGPVSMAMKTKADACGEKATRVCYGVDGGESQNIDVEDVTYAENFLRYIGPNNNDAMWTMASTMDCAEWTLPLPEGSAILALAKHINPQYNSSVLYEDIATTINGDPNATSGDQKNLGRLLLDAAYMADSPVSKLDLNILPTTRISTRRADPSPMEF